MKIKRYIFSQLIEKLRNDNKIIVLYGARQVGKTSLVKQVVNELGLKTLLLNADIDQTAKAFGSQDFDLMNSIVDSYDLLVIDEAQRIENIGLNLKILYDQKPNLKIIATGSSSFELANKISEPLTGRKWTYNLYPISFLELKSHFNNYELQKQLEERMIYGSYPELFKYVSREDRRNYLLELSSAYLYKDVLELETIKHSRKIHDLLKLLSFQIGSEVSLSELAQRLEMATETVDRYIDLLEKSFVIFRLSGFSRNLRNEVTKKQKIYFYDLGIRNIIIDNLKPLEDRNDLGALFENLMISERYKRNKYTHGLESNYFWRLRTGAEIDYIEEGNGELFAYEFKYSKNKARIPKSWQDNYGDNFSLVNKNTFLDFVLRANDC